MDCKRRQKRSAGEGEPMSSERSRMNPLPDTMTLHVSQLPTVYRFVKFHIAVEYDEVEGCARNSA